jgi:O-antigen/teichoic acid export membrane protein
MIFSNLELYFEKSHFILISSVVGASSNVVLNYFLIPEFGYFAAGYTTVIGFILMCVCHIVFAMITCKKENVPFSRIYSIKNIILITVILAALCFVSMLFYNRIIPRYLLFAATLVITAVKRKSVISLFKGLKEEKTAGK